MRQSLFDQSPSEDLPLEKVDRPTPAPRNTEVLQGYLNAATSDNTRRAYRSAIRQFERWGGRLPTDTDTLLRYLTDRADQVNIRTLDLHITAISQWHLAQGINDPTRHLLISKAMKGMRNAHGKPKKKAKALRPEDLATMLRYLQTLPESEKPLRDKALLLTGYLGAFRRSELVAIEVADLRFEPEGLIIHLPRSKTDQEGQGLLRAVPTGAPGVCAATAIQEWLDYAGISEGPVFRPVNRWGMVQHKALSPAAVNETLKAIGKACGFDFVPDLSSHSLRRGMSTSAAREKVDFAAIKKQGGWKSDSTVRGYIEEGGIFEDNAASVLMNKIAKLVG